MKHFHKWKAFLLMSLFLVAIAVPAQADSIWTVNGTLSRTGNDLCAGPCIETLTFSFEFQWVPLLPGYPVYGATVVPGTMSVNSSGPLGQFTGGGFNLGEGYIAFSNFAHDQLEFRVSRASTQTDPDAAPIFSGPDLYSCWTMTCATDFVPPNSPWYGRPLPYLGLFLPATLDYSLTPIPEPSIGPLLLCGLLLLVIVKKNSTSSLSPHSSVNHSKTC